MAGGEGDCVLEDDAGEDVGEWAGGDDESAGLSICCALWACVCCWWWFWSFRLASSSAMHWLSSRMASSISSRSSMSCVSQGVTQCRYSMYTHAHVCVRCVQIFAYVYVCTDTHGNTDTHAKKCGDVNVSADACAARCTATSTRTHECICTRASMHLQIHNIHVCTCIWAYSHIHTLYGVATVSRIDEIIGLFCRILSLL